MSENLYFVAVVPPEKIQREITELKKLVAEKFESKHALNAPPHITLHMPFRWKDKKIEKLHNTIHEINDDMRSFDVELHGFDFFEPRVVFVKVIKNAALSSLQRLVVDLCARKLKLDNGNYKNQVFHPHVTIGFRDLRKKKFYEAKAFFQEQVISRKFRVKRVELLKHDGAMWRVFD